MHQPITCRKALKSDLPAILNLYAQPDMDNNEIASVYEAEKIFDRIKSYPNYNVYVAIFENRIVGSFALLIMDNLAHRGALSAIIEDVTVSTDLQRRGIGKTMMEFALREAKKANCYKATLSSNLKREQAHKFYESLNFERHGYSFKTEF